MDNYITEWGPSDISTAMADISSKLSNGEITQIEASEKMSELKSRLDLYAKRQTNQSCS